MPDQSGPCARGDTVCTRFVARREASVTPEGQELHGRVVSGQARVSPLHAGLSAVVPVLPLGDGNTGTTDNLILRYNL